MQVRKYKQSILASDLSTREYQNINFAKWSADKVEDNIATLTLTFYSMGIIEMVSSGEIKLKAIECLQERILIDEDINNCDKVPVVQYMPGPNKNTGDKNYTKI